MSTEEKKLNEWYAGSPYEDIKIFVAPDQHVTAAAVAGSLLASIGRLERGELPRLTEVL